MARATLREAQAEYERDTDAVKEARRRAYLAAQAAGLSLREIGEVVGLHHTRISQIVRGE